MSAAPGAPFLAALVLLGVIVPSGFVLVVLRRLVLERERFELRALLETYFSVVLIFAAAYATLQAGGVAPAFSGMPTVWGTEASMGLHLERLHEVFGNALYLSVVTMTTVGFGDIAPLSAASKALTALQGLLGIGFVGLVLGQYFAVCLSCSPGFERE